VASCALSSLHPDTTKQSAIKPATTKESALKLDPSSTAARIFSPVHVGRKVCGSPHQTVSSLARSSQEDLAFLADWSSPAPQSYTAPYLQIDMSY
jgi:hypothetical protein